MQDIGSEIKKSSKASAFTLIVAFISVALVGLALVPLLPVKLNPSRTLPGFSVWFGMGGTSARVVEMTATSKLEAMLARVKGIQSISSTSGNGWGSINVSLDKHADAAVARFEASTIILSDLAGIAGRELVTRTFRWQVRSRKVRDLLSHSRLMRLPLPV